MQREAKSISTFALCMTIANCTFAHAQISPTVSSQTFSSSGGVSTLKEVYSDGTVRTTTGTRDAVGRMTYERRKRR
jgi:hypothetical protein